MNRLTVDESTALLRYIFPHYPDLRTRRKTPNVEKFLAELRRIVPVCECGEKDTKVCADNPDCRPSYCKLNHPKVIDAEGLVLRQGATSLPREPLPARSETSPDKMNIKAK